MSLKLYETWEVLRDLKMGVDKEFANGKNINIVLFNKDGRIAIKDVKKDHAIINLGIGFINDVWIEINKPVDFTDVIEAFDKGRDIYCIVDGRRFDFINKPYKGLKDTMNNPISSRDILKGEWYIS